MSKNLFLASLLFIGSACAAEGVRPAIGHGALRVLSGMLPKGMTKVLQTHFLLTVTLAASWLRVNIQKIPTFGR